MLPLITYSARVTSKEEQQLPKDVFLYIIHIYINVCLKSYWSLARLVDSLYCMKCIV